MNKVLTYVWGVHKNAQSLSVWEDEKQAEVKGKGPLEPSGALFLCCYLLTYNSTEAESSAFESALPGEEGTLSR